MTERAYSSISRPAMYLPSQSAPQTAPPKWEPELASHLGRGGTVGDGEGILFYQSSCMYLPSQSVTQTAPPEWEPELASHLGRGGAVGDGEGMLFYQSSCMYLPSQSAPQTAPPKWEPYPLSLLRRQLPRSGSLIEKPPRLLAGASLLSTLAGRGYRSLRSVYFVVINLYYSA